MFQENKARQVFRKTNISYLMFVFRKIWCAVFSRKKACQDTDIATKVIKNSSNIFAGFFFLNLNSYIASSVFPSNLKNADSPVSILLNISKHIKSVSFPKSQITSKRYCQSIDLVFKKNIVHNNVCWS